jgi:hypothetical protein
VSFALAIKKRERSNRINNKNKRHRVSEQLMNVLIINASPRNKGITSLLLNEIEATINPSRNVVEVVRIQELDIKPCMGCLKCRPDKTCILPQDDAHILAEKIKESDLLIIGSPVYWGNMPGTLKIFFDRNVPLFEYCEAKAIKYIPKPQLRIPKQGNHSFTQNSSQIWWYQDNVCT